MIMLAGAVFWQTFDDFGGKRLRAFGDHVPDGAFRAMSGWVGCVRNVSG
jgi:hypothetical protein